MRTTKDLVGTFTREDHLDSHSLDLSGQEVHGSGSSDGGDVESLQVVNDFFNGVKTFLKSKGVFVVDCSEEIGSFSSGDQIGCTWKTDCERVQLRPRSECRLLIY